MKATDTLRATTPAELATVTGGFSLIDLFKKAVHRLPLPRFPIPRLPWPF
jgi:hypothetical protein